MSYPRPDEAADWSAVSYSRVLKRIAGYSYERAYLIRSYLRKRKGYKRRVRVNVVEIRTIHVPARILVTPWIVEFPPEPKPKPKAKWLNVKDYEYQLETMISYYGGELTEYEMPIFNLDIENDWIHIPSLFVWPVRKFPRHFPDLERRYGKYGKKPFSRVRIWFIVRKDDEEEFQVWCRTATIFPSEFEGLYKYALDLFKTAKVDQEEYNEMVRRHDPQIKSNTTPEGFTVQELVAWTGYTIGQKAQGKPSTKLGLSA